MTIEKNPISRRNLVTTLGAGLAGSILTSAMPDAEGQASKDAPASARLSIRRRSIRSRRIQAKANHGLDWPAKCPPSRSWRNQL